MEIKALVFTSVPSSGTGNLHGFVRYTT